MKFTSVLALTIVAAPAAALAFAPPAHLDGHGLLVIDGPDARGEPAITWSTPAEANAAWAKFISTNGTKWRAQFDAHTKIARRVYGQGIAHRGSTADPDVAVSFARSAIAAHLDLLAPGSRITDFEMAANDLDEANGMRTVTFLQKSGGYEVLGGAVSVRIKNDRLFVFGSAAFPNVGFEAPKTLASKGALHQAALKLVETDATDVSLFRGAEDTFVLPIVQTNGNTTYHVVREVVVHASTPLGRWSVYLDAQTAAPIARQQTLKFAAGTIKFNTSERRPGSTRTDFVARDANITVDGQNGTTDGAGNITFQGTEVTGTVSPIGPEVRVDNNNGARASTSFTVTDGGEFVWNDADDEEVDAQLNTFIAARVVKERARIISPNLRWLDDAVQATVNINDSCNAFSDGTTINFFQSSRRCENTGRLPDVVYHEYGHSFHAHVIIRGAGGFDGALSEGASDYMSATITNDPGMGRGFFRSNAPLRHIDPDNSEAVWPEDVAEPHTTGLIFAGAMWDLRKQLIIDFGDEAQAIAYTDNLWYQALRRSGDIPSTYVEVLAADDDDGDISNGTPNNCSINAAFARHGLADSETVAPPIGKPTLDPMLKVTLPVGTIENACPGATIRGASLDWRVRSAPNTGGRLPMVSIAAGYEEQIPSQEFGTVVQYRVEVELESGEKIFLPNNAADPFYEYFVGEVTPIYCTSFEGDPEQEGWTHALLQGEDREGADDWTFGPVMSPANSGDPSDAYDGNAVAGNDLGGGNYNGRYQPGKQNILRSPAIPTGAFEVVRLQYRRWLSVEDADFDQAQILANNDIVWSNFSTGNNGDTHHQDREWRFHDVDLTAQASGGSVEVAFRLTTDRGLELGGWTVDDLCVVGYNVTPPAVCGNGTVESGEACDDGNDVLGDGCEVDCTITVIMPGCGDGNLDVGEICDDGNQIAGDGCELNCTATISTDPECAADPNCTENPETLKQLDADGCGCNATGTESPSAAWLLLFAGLLFVRRRR